MSTKEEELTRVFIANAGRMNFVSVIPVVILGALIPNSRDGVTMLGQCYITRIRSTTLTEYVSDKVQTYLSTVKSRIGRLRITDPPTFEAFTVSTARIWHDALNDISAVRSVNMQQMKLKMQAIDMWKSYGKAFGLQEGVRVISVKGPSTQSRKRAYWRITRRCFYMSCPCAGSQHMCHSMRVCKGCYRVLYCNERCQAK